MAESELGQQLGVAVQAAFAPAAGYLALVVQSSPDSSADDLLRRPDIDAELTSALESARSAALAVTGQAWFAAGAGSTSVYRHLLSDVSAVFDALPHLRGLIRRAYAPAGAGLDAARDRAAAVQAAVLRWARQAAVRARMTVSMAEGAGAASSVLADALARDAEGAPLRKRWLAHIERGNCCIWCRRLHGVTVGLRESFAPYLGAPAELPHTQARQVRSPAGERRYGLPLGSRIIYTHPPRLYHGELQGPLLHPFCQCRMEIVPAAGQAASSWPRVRRLSSSPAGFLTAASVRAIPDEQYEAQVTFMKAAVHELGLVLQKLSEGRRPED
jgi:hypothetical protein